jgi:hypothetical protein
VRAGAASPYRAPGPHARSSLSRGPHQHVVNSHGGRLPGPVAKSRAFRLRRGPSRRLVRLCAPGRRPPVHLPPRGPAPAARAPSPLHPA